MVVVKVILGIMLLAALGHLPYGYYIILRWGVTIGASISTFDAFSKDRGGWGWIFIAMAILYNPIIPVYLTKAIWTPINIVTAVLIFVSIGAFRKSSEYSG